MLTTSSCHIELIAGSVSRDDVQAVLNEAGYRVSMRTFSESIQPAHLYVVDGGQQPDQALMRCQRLRQEQGDTYTPILFLTAPGASRLPGLERGADTTLMRPFAPAELLAQVHALLRAKERHDQLAGKAAEATSISQRLHEANHQINLELDLARRLQESFLPQTLPQLPRVRFAVKYKPVSKVGGDFYDVFRLDEKHVGFYVADAMGHGVPASLLTIFVKKGVHAKEITGQSYRLVPPNEVLFRLNNDLVEQQIPDLPFITMTYVLFNYQNGELQFSRAGHPHPVYIPHDGKLVQWPSEGSLLGVFETKYRIQSRQLKPGDKLILFTDGMDGASFGQHAVGLASLLAAAGEFRSLAINELVERLASDLFTQTRQADDLTIFGMEVTK